MSSNTNWLNIIVGFVYNGYRAITWCCGPTSTNENSKEYVMRSVDMITCYKGMRLPIYWNIEVAQLQFVK